MQWRDLAFVVSFAIALILSGCSHDWRNAKGARGRTGASASVGDHVGANQRLVVQKKLELALNKLQVGDYSASEQIAQELLTIDPNIADAYSVLAIVNERQGGHVAAGENYRKAAELAPKQVQSLNNYGAWLCDNGHAAEALVWLDRARTYSAGHESAALLANAGGCAMLTGQVERGLPDLRRALELDPSNAFALESMARHEYVGQRYLQARAFSERRLAAAPATASVLQLAIHIESALGDKAAASRYQQRLLEEFPATTTASPGDKAL